MTRLSEPDQVRGYRVYLSRHASWTVHNELDDDRTALKDALTEYLKGRASFPIRRPIYFLHASRARRTGYVFAADSPEEHQPNIIVFAIQPDLAGTAPSAGSRGTCHVTTEMSQAETHSLIGTSVEFASGARPAKRLNYVVLSNGDCRQLDDGVQVEETIKHFVSAAYSTDGLSLLDFVLTVRHRPPLGGEYPPSEWSSDKAGYLDALSTELQAPLRNIAHKLEQDQGEIAPRGLANLDDFVRVICAQAAETAYMNLAIYREEQRSNVNPQLHVRFGEVVLPAEQRDQDEAGEDRLERSIRQLVSDKQWFTDNLKRLRADLGSRFAAVANCRVRMHDPDRAKLKLRMKSECGPVSYYLGDLQEPPPATNEETVVPRESPHGYDVSLDEE